MKPFLHTYALSTAALLALLVLPAMALSDAEFPFDPEKGKIEAEAPGKKKKTIPAVGKDINNCVTCEWVYSPAEKVPDLVGIVREAKKSSVKAARKAYAKAMAEAIKKNRATRIKALKETSAMIKSLSNRRP
jgi:delta 1-pyrroline-5-carboxylate dehydrogenase